MQSRNLRKPLMVTDFEPGAGQPNRLYFSQPRTVELVWQAKDVLPALQRIDQATRQGCWAVGYLAYEAAAGLNSKMAEAMRIQPDAKHEMPLLAFALFDGPDPTPQFASSLPATQLCSPSTESKEHTMLHWQESEGQNAYIEKIADIRQAIAAGDVYQVNYTLRTATQAESNFIPWNYYESLRKRQQCQYGAYLDFGDHQILSLSPELFFDWNRDSGQIITRPMKGTAARGSTRKMDEEQAQQLRSSPKERAENVMIVDLLRNDLGRIATTGSVKVQQLLHTEAYPTLWQMTSTIQATAQPNTTLVQMLQALFPCGSITGAPKLMAMRKIAALESSPRGIYCGAIGIINPERAIFNVAIRTISFNANGYMRCGSGGGITWPSNAREEYAETLLKLQFLYTAALPRPDFNLRETLLLVNGRFALLPLHLQRIAQSARTCGFSPVSLYTLTQALQTFAEKHNHGYWRVTLTQAATGQIHVEGSPFSSHQLQAPGSDWHTDDGLPLHWMQPSVDIKNPPRPHPVTLAASANSVDSCWLLHKTTQRTHYDAALALYPHAWDVILHNKAGFATECTRGNLVLQTKQGYFTPPLTHGLLPGVLRETLLARKAIQEGPIPVQRLLQPHAGDTLWFINSVRGWLPIKLDHK